MRRHAALVMLAIALLVAAGGAAAQSFDRFHPDQYHREKGVAEAEAGRHEQAVKSFMSAAKYADKASQLVLALAYWHGDGAPVDHPRAYAWADLAAERGWPAYLGVREQMWAQLDEGERAQAVEIGKQLVPEYGDAVAKKRLERLLFQGSRKKTGSRTGSATSGVGTAQLDSSGRASMYASLFTSGLNNSEAKPGGNAGIKGFIAGLRGLKAYQAIGYYDDANWKPKAYWNLQNQVWGDLPKGVVTIQPLRPADG